MNFKQMNLLRSTPAVAEDQAEITWPLAFKAGMQEVVEWIQKNHVELVPYLEPAICILTSEWQAFLKERGLEK